MKILPYTHAYLLWKPVFQEGQMGHFSLLNEGQEGYFTLKLRKNDLKRILLGQRGPIRRGERNLMSYRPRATATSPCFSASSPTRSSLAQPPSLTLSPSPNRSLYPPLSPFLSLPHNLSLSFWTSTIVSDLPAPAIFSAHTLVQHEQSGPKWWGTASQLPNHHCWWWWAARGEAMAPRHPLSSSSQF